MEENFYTKNPDLRDYFNSLPVDIQNQILDSNGEISTLGELMQISEHLKASI